MKQGADQDRLDDIQRQLDIAARVPHPLTKPRKSKAVKGPDGKVKPYKRWSAPEGWRPPGWKSDADAYNRAKSAMGFVQNPKSRR